MTAFKKVFKMLQLANGVEFFFFLNGLIHLKRKPNIVYNQSYI